MAFPVDQSTRRPFDYGNKIDSFKPRIDKTGTDTYRYVIEFFNRNGEVVETTSFGINIPSRSQGKTASRIIDIYSQNGTSAENPRFLNELFTDEDVRGIQTASEKFSKERAATTTTIIVLDLKDSKKMYDDSEEIRTAEDLACRFFESKDCDDPTLNENAKKVQSIFAGKMPVDFVFREGSLKAAISRRFSPELREYFLCTGSKGRKNFCQFVEIPIAAMKNGHIVEGLPPFQEFIETLPGKAPFSPTEEQDTWYPESYRDLYSPESELLGIIQGCGCFPNVALEMDGEYGITSMKFLPSSASSTPDK